MSASLIPTPVMQFFDSNGDPLSGGKVYTYAAGTSTPLATYTDQGGATPNANPVILDSRGEAAIWFGVSSTSSYKIVLKTSADVLIWTADNITGSLASLAGSGGSSLVGFLQSGTGAVARTVQAKERDVVSVKDFGAVGDGVVDDHAAIQAALNVAATSNAAVCVFMPQGVYSIGTSTLTIPSRVTLEGAGIGSTFVNYSGSGTAIDVAGVSRWRLQNFRLGYGSSATIVGIKIRTTTGNSVLYGQVNSIEFAGSSEVIGAQTVPKTGAKGIVVVASGSDIVQRNTFNDLSFYYIDKPIECTSTESNTWNGIHIDTFGSTAGVSAIYCVTCHDDFMQAHISLGPLVAIAGNNNIGYYQSGNDCVAQLAVDIQAGGNTSLSVSGLKNIVTLTRPTGLTPYGTIADDNLLLDGYEGIHLGRTWLRHGVITSVASGSAVTIYTGTAANAFVSATIAGDDGGSGWMDVVQCVLSGTPITVSSSTMYGAPPTRTYTSTTNLLKLQISSGTQNVRVSPTEVT